MSKKKLSLQDLAFRKSSDSLDDLTKHYLRLYAKGKLNQSNGDALRHLKQVGVITGNGQFSALAASYLEELRHAPQTQYQRPQPNAGGDPPDHGEDSIP